MNCLDSYTKDMQKSQSNSITVLLIERDRERELSLLTMYGWALFSLNSMGPHYRLL